MFWLIIFLLCLSVAVNVFLGFVIMRYANILTKVEENINSSLDQLDLSYQEIVRVLEIPIFYDSAEVRMVLSSIDRSRIAVLTIANKLANSMPEDEKDNNDDDEQ